MEVKKQLWLPCRHFLNQTEDKWAYMLAIPSFLSAPSLKEIQCSSYGSKCVYIQDGHQAAILNDIKNLFDLHNPRTIPDLGVKCLFDPYTSEKSLSTEVQKYGCTDGQRPNYKPPNPSGYLTLTLLALFAFVYGRFFCCIVHQNPMQNEHVSDVTMPQQYRGYVDM